MTNFTGSVVSRQLLCHAKSIFPGCKWRTSFLKIGKPKYCANTICGRSYRGYYLDNLRLALPPFRTGIKSINVNPTKKSRGCISAISLSYFGTMASKNSSKETQTDEFYSMKSVALSRLMAPDDANIAGNVHGGTILKMIEEAGVIITTKYCNHAKTSNGPIEPSVCALARVEKTDFLQPMFIGEVAELTAEIIYTSPHSLLVEVRVVAENILKGQKRLTNKARLWYVPLSIHDSSTVLPVPPMIYTDPKVEQMGKDVYLQQKEERKHSNINQKTICLQANADSEPYTVVHSQSQLIHLVNPSDVVQSGFCRGGVILKMMDECAGMVAAKHCKTNIVTASLDATNFHQKVPKGGLVTLLAQAVFTSNKTIEIEVVVDVEVPWGVSNIQKQRAVDAFFTFVSLDDKRKTLPVPPLKLLNDEEKSRFEAGQKRYDLKKQKRAECASS